MASVDRQAVVSLHRRVSGLALHARGRREELPEAAAGGGGRGGAVDVGAAEAAAVRVVVVLPPRLTDGLLSPLWRAALAWAHPGAGGEEGGGGGACARCQGHGARF